MHEVFALGTLSQPHCSTWQCSLYCGVPAHSIACIMLSCTFPAILQHAALSQQHRAQRSQERASREWQVPQNLEMSPTHLGFKSLVVFKLQVWLRYNLKPYLFKV